MVDLSAFDKLQNDVVVTLCLPEKYFPPSFFDIILHLVVHLVTPPITRGHFCTFFFFTITHEQCP